VFGTARPTQCRRTRDPCDTYARNGISVRVHDCNGSRRHPRLGCVTVSHRLGGSEGLIGSLGFVLPKSIYVGQTSLDVPGDRQARVHLTGSTSRGSPVPRSHSTRWETRRPTPRTTRSRSASSSREECQLRHGSLEASRLSANRPPHQELRRRQLQDDAAEVPPPGPCARTSRRPVRVRTVFPTACARPSGKIVGTAARIDKGERPSRSTARSTRPRRSREAFRRAYNKITPRAGSRSSAVRIADRVNEPTATFFHTIAGVASGPTVSSADSLDRLDGDEVLSPLPV